MKKLLIVLSVVAVTLFGCNEKKQDEVKPAVSTSTNSSEQERANLCDIATKLVEKDLYGHSYWLEYYDDSTGMRLNIPGLFSPTMPNKLVWASDGSGVEYSYLDYTTPFNSGTFIISDCGKTVTINTLFLYPNVKLTFTELTIHSWSGTIPKGSGGVPVTVRVKATKIS